MNKPDIKSVGGYIAAQPAAVQSVLKRVRSVIRKAVPGAAEVISYRIPAYVMHGAPVIYFAGWARHFAIYPAGSLRVAAAFKKDLQPYKVSRGTIRFPLSEPVPAKLIERIAKFRAKEVAGLAMPRPASTRKR